MLISHVQAYVVGGNSLHFQATGPAFPQGYASGNREVSTDAFAAVEASQGKRPVGSLRPGSGSKYALLRVGIGGIVTDSGVVVCGIADLCEALNAPSPAYSKTSATVVTDHVAKRLTEAQNVGTSSFDDEDDEEVEALREENEDLKARLATLSEKLDALRKALA